MRTMKLVDIVVGERLRGLDDDAVAELVQSIDKSGLFSPIIVNAKGLDNGKCLLVAGHNRLEAMRKLGREEVPVIILEVGHEEAQLIEIDENLIRKELTALEKSDLHALRKKIYESFHPETKKGGDHKSPEVKSKRQTGGLKSYAHDASAKTRQSPRTIQRLVKIGTDLDPEAKKLLQGTTVADKGTELTELSKLPAETQKAVAQIISEGKAHSVRVGLELLGMHEETAGQKPITDKDRDGSALDTPPADPASETTVPEGGGDGQADEEQSPATSGGDGIGAAGAAELAIPGWVGRLAEDVTADKTWDYILLVRKHDRGHNPDWQHELQAGAKLDVQVEADGAAVSVKFVCVNMDEEVACFQDEEVIWEK